MLRDVRGPLTQTGRGPGEHSGWGILTSNTKYIYYTDANTARINRYTYEMTPVDPIKKFQFSRSVDLNNKIILTQNRSNSGFHPVKPEEGLRWDQSGTCSPCRTGIYWPLL